MTLWAKSAGDKLLCFSYFSQKTGFDIFMQVVSTGDNLNERSKLIFLRNKKYISKCPLVKFLPRVGNV